MKLTSELLIRAYAQGIFPMAQGRQILWYDPDPRAIIPLETFHVPRSLQRRIRQGIFEVKVNRQFKQVMTLCAAPAKGRYSTWISAEFVRLYTQLHEMGAAHSVETYLDGALVGGLYGVSLGGLFAGESMFSRATDASKVALVHLVERLRAGGYTLLDTQFKTDHLARFGVLEIPRSEYKARLASALQTRTTFYPEGFSSS